jgi:predicted metal-dependent hydrolase
VHDLVPVLERVRQRYFGGIGDVAICWGAARVSASRRRRRARTRSRALATYSFDDRTIRVSPVLDSARVPEFVLEWIVYHEMLHHVLPCENGNGRRRLHTRRFRALERGFERYGEAQAWEKANLDWLLA